MVENRLIQDLRQNLIHHLGRPAGLDAIIDIEMNLKQIVKDAF